MSVLQQPRMCWLVCGHEAVTMRPVYPGRKLHCATCRQAVRITHVGEMGAINKQEVPPPTIRPKPRLWPGHGCGWLRHRWGPTWSDFVKTNDTPVQDCEECGMRKAVGSPVWMTMDGY